MDYQYVLAFPAAYDKRRAAERLEAITDTVMLQGASGKQVRKDKHGKIEKGEGTVELVDFTAHLAYLERAAGFAASKTAPTKDPREKRRELLRLLKERE